MLKPIIVTFLFTMSCLIAFGQQSLPVLKTNTKNLSIKDGDILRTNYWGIDSQIKLDVYVADKVNRPKQVTFYSDIDSISFQLEPRAHHDFWVIFNGQDSCLTRLQSGLTFDPTQVTSLTRDTIPFVLNDASNIIIQAVLNEVDTLNLMFHTAQSSIALTEAATAKMKSLQLNQSNTSNSWGGSSQVRYSQGNRLQINRFSWEQLTIWEDKHSGPETDGKCGPNLFEDKIIELNYDAQIMVIHSELPTLEKDFVKQDLHFRRGSMFLDIRCGIDQQVYPRQVLIHSGYGGTLLLDDAFVNEHQLGKQLEVISESQLTDSHGHIIKTKKALLPSLALGGHQFVEVPIGFFEGTIGRQSMSVFGSELIKRFNIYFDLQRAEIYLKPNSYFNHTFIDS